MEFHRTFIFNLKVVCKSLDGIQSNLYYIPKVLVKSFDGIPSNLYFLFKSRLQKPRWNSIEPLIFSKISESKGSLEFHRTFFILPKVLVKWFDGIPSKLYFLFKSISQKVRWNSIEPLFLI